MRRMAMVALVVALLPALAQADGGGFTIGGRLTGYLGPGGYGGGGTQLGPWYLYWPLEAHFQTPAPPAYPYWPQGAGLGAVPPGAIPVGPVGPYGPGGPVLGPNVMSPGPAQFHAPQIVPVGYQRTVPYYWYNR